MFQPKPEVPTSEPITHPLYGAAPVQPLPTNGYGDVNPLASQPYNPAPLYPQNAPSMYQPPATANSNFSQQAFNPGNFNQNAIPGLTPQQQQMAQEMARPETPQPVEKAPIPEEHMHMKTVLDELRNQCSRAANNPVSLLLPYLAANSCVYFLNFFFRSKRREN